MLKKANIAVLVSGGGTNLEALLGAQEAGAIPHGQIVFVCASNETAYALTRAAKHGVACAAIPRKQMSQEAFEAAFPKSSWITTWTSLFSQAFCPFCPRILSSSGRSGSSMFIPP